MANRVQSEWQDLAASALIGQEMMTRFKAGLEVQSGSVLRFEAVAPEQAEVAAWLLEAAIETSIRELS